MDDKEPPIRRLVLKPREADPGSTGAQPGAGGPAGSGAPREADVPAEEPPSEIRWDGIPIRQPGNGDAPVGPSVFRPKEIVPMDPPSFPGDESAINVHGMLHQNRQAADESGPELIAMPRRRRSRRHRDFGLVLVGAAASFVVLGLMFIHNLPFLGLATFGIVFTTVILGWIIYGVMDRY
jgi:hypothetical protein